MNPNQHQHHTHASLLNHVEPKELVFNGPFTSPVSQTIVLPVTPSRDGYIDLRSTIGDDLVNVVDYFHVNSMRVTEIGGGGGSDGSNRPNEAFDGYGTGTGNGHGYLAGDSGKIGTNGGPGNHQSRKPSSKEEITRQSKSIVYRVRVNHLTLIDSHVEAG
jgi:hypothetical protein